VYTHKPPAQLLRPLEGQRIHRGDEIEFYALDRDRVRPRGAAPRRIVT
jgi:hypothetical protein